MSSRLDAARPDTDPSGTVQYRPAIHYTTQDTWLNDPNGLVWHGGNFHLYYQTNPSGSVWGNMSWGHATSKDLVHWTEHPVAIAGDEHEDIFSGSIVVDRDNCSGFGDRDAPPLVAVYTSAFKETSEHRGTQAQSLAYSNDGGMTWTKYAGNPVLSRGSANFRDPKVFRYDGPDGSWWVMVAVEAQHQQVVLYRSEDLRKWEFLSSFGPANAYGGEWECPDLFPLPLDGDRGTIKWVMVVSLNPGAVAGGSGSQYFVGEFDGVRFTPDASSLVDVKGQPDDGAALRRCLWLDWGRDYYAAVSFSDVPDNRRVMIGWMNNWDYANTLPTSPWRSGMSLAREISLTTTDGEPRLVQRPILPATRTNPVHRMEQQQLRDTGHRLPDFVPGSAQLIEAEILPGTACTVGFRLLGAPDGASGTVLDFNAATGELTLDRSRSGNTGFHRKFASASSAPVKLDDGVLRLRIVVDHCSVEVFAQGGSAALTDLVFPDDGCLSTEIFSDGGSSTVRSLTVESLR